MKGTYSAFYVINIVSQAIFTLVWQIALGLGIGWLLVRFAGAKDWVYVPFILTGVITGLVSMVRFVLAAMNALDRIEGDKKAKNKARTEK